jgi:hypothetical protein
MGRIEIGRKLFRSKVSLFLGNGMTFADFQASGKEFVKIHKL